MGKLDGKVAIITGVGAGIGEATARLFVKEGATIVGCDVSPKAEAVIQSVLDESGKATFVQGDVSSEEDTERVVQMALDDYGKIDYLINIAGIVSPGRVDTHTVEEWDKNNGYQRTQYLFIIEICITCVETIGGLHNKCFFFGSIKGCQRTSGIFCDKGSCYGVNPSNGG